jgi:RNA 2',3'-cyclic 3'-phosphodiesterase
VSADASGVERLFLALWPDAKVRARCAQLAHAAGAHNGKPVPAENLHITLCFLGAVDAPTRSCIESALQEVRAAPVTLILDRLGYFPKPRVLWLGAAQVPEPLSALACTIDRLARGCGVSTDTRPFVAHMTVQRKANKAPALPEIEPVPWLVTTFALVKSETLSTGAVYTVLRTWPLVEV